ncbi:LOW QUALITY PROTEIN: delta-like protein 3 [Lathamus discolor]|uniref:LOW QUALITY PROTEIN: delta-like protein 3 n=1 Tax=Lathamus discolor TaxID=678569 RepID=UPI0032B82F50
MGVSLGGGVSGGVSLRSTPGGCWSCGCCRRGGGAGGPLVFRLCLRPPGGGGCSLGVTHSPPGPPPRPGAPRTLRLPLAYPWPGTVSLVIESWRLEEAKGSGALRGRLLGRAVTRQRLSPGGPWRGGAGGGLRFGTRLRCRPPTCARRCRPLPAVACGGPNPRRCWSPPRRGCRDPCAPHEGSACSKGGPCTGHGSGSPGPRCDGPSLARALGTAPGAPGTAPGMAPGGLGAPGMAPGAPTVAQEVLEVAPVAQSSPSPCALGPCFNGGACAPRGRGFSCRCPPGFRGANCERRSHGCALEPCLHGGQCRSVPGGAPLCRCRPGFSGRRCERNEDECSPNPCANGGTCQDGANAFHCTCTLGYGGRRCQERTDACASGPCRHGATCYTHISGHVCACARGYMGELCEEPVPVPVARGPRAPVPVPVPLVLACAVPVAVLGTVLGLARCRRRKAAGERCDLAPLDPLKKPPPMVPLPVNGFPPPPMPPPPPPPRDGLDPGLRAQRA